MYYRCVDNGGVQKEDPTLILLLCSSITHLWPLLETNHCSRSLNGKNCFSPLTFPISLQAVRPFYSILDIYSSLFHSGSFYSILFYSISVLSIREDHLNYARKTYPKWSAGEAGGGKRDLVPKHKVWHLADNCWHWSCSAALLPIKHLSTKVQ